MAQLNLGAIKDLGGVGGFTFSSGGITANGSLTVTDIDISGTIAGSSGYVLPTNKISFANDVCKYSKSLKLECYVKK